LVEEPQLVAIANGDGRRVLSLETSISANVQEIDSVLLPQRSPDQQAPVAFGWILLAAHDRNAKAAAAGGQAVETVLEGRRPRDGAIEDVTVLVVVLAAGGPPAQLGAEEEVPDSGPSDQAAKRGLGKAGDE
jgi:hypothetical protein